MLLSDDNDGSDAIRGAYKTLHVKYIPAAAASKRRKGSVLNLSSQLPSSFTRSKSKDAINQDIDLGSITDVYMYAHNDRFCAVIKASTTLRIESRNANKVVLPC